MMQNKYTEINWNLLCAAWNKSLGKDSPPLGSWERGVGEGGV